VRWRVLLSICTGTGLLAGSLIATAAPAPASASVSALPSAVPLFAFNSGLVLTVANRARPGTAVRIEADSGRSGQRWVFASHETVRPASNSRLCLTVAGARYLPGTRLVVSACGSAASQRFVRAFPSAHTRVFFIKPAARTGFCVSVSEAGAPGFLQAGDQGALERCAALDSQAWSTSNLSGVTDALGSNDWVMQALQPTVAGSAVTGANLFADKLDQFWTATVTGPQERQLVQLRPVDDTAMCLTLPSAEATGARLVLAICDGAANQEFMAIEFFFSRFSPYLIATPDSRFCVQAAATGPASTRNITIAGCNGNSNNNVWDTSLPLVTTFVIEYDELYADSGSLQYSMTVSGRGGPGSGVVVEPDTELAAQVWTEVRPGQSRPQANADGSSTLRPLSDERLCLTVPGARYAAGVQLTVQTCDGSVGQEFLHSGTAIANSQQLIALGDGQFCVGEPGAVGAGHPVELEPCNQHANQAWMQYSDWIGWAGFVGGIFSGSSNRFDGPAITLTSSTATGGQVSLGPFVPGATSQMWHVVPPSDGSFQTAGAFRSVFNPGLCLDAPSAAAGTQLDAAPCSGGSGQVFDPVPVPQAYPFIEYELGQSGMCMAATAGTSGPLTLAACAGQPDELWIGGA
jgi:hypothetical protein